MFSLSFSWLSACGLQIPDPTAPAAVGATVDVVATNRRLNCNFSGIKCVWEGVTITSVDPRPEDVFRPEGNGGTLRAVAPGEAVVRIVGVIGPKTKSGRVRLEAAEPEAIDLVFDGGFSFDRIVLAPGTEVLAGWAATDAQGRSLVGADLLAWGDPSGAVDVATIPDQDQLLVLTAPDAPTETELVSITGDRVGVRIADGVIPDEIEVLFGDGLGVVAVPVRVVGQVDGEAVLSSDLPVTLEALTPEVCVAEGGATLGTATSLTVVAPGTCSVRASAQLSRGRTLEAEGSGEVAPPIPREEGT